MSSVEELHSRLACPKCGALQPRETELCWLCSAKATTEGNDPASVDLVQVAPERFSFSLSTLLLLMTLASVCMGLLVVAPGLGVPMCVLLVPVLVRTMMVVRRREAVGLAVSRIEKISLMASSFGVATVLAVVVSAAAFAGFCGVCLLMVSPDNKYGGPGILAWGVGMCAVAAFAVWLTIRVMKWIRRRYRRDVGLQTESFNAEDAVAQRDAEEE